MKIYPVNNQYYANSTKQKRSNNINFGAGTFRFVTFSDLHGNLKHLVKLTGSMEKHFDEIFDNNGQKSSLNIMSIAGDFGINQNQTGYLSNPQMNSGDIQMILFRKFINTIRSLFTKDSDFKIVFTPGNHDFDGGDGFLINCFKQFIAGKMPIKTVLSNLRNIKNFEGYNVVKSAVYEVSDSVNPKMKHKVMVLGTTLNNMNYYNSGLIKEMEFFENINLPDAKLAPEVFDETIAALNKEIQAFKKENPDGAVVLMSHSGKKISEYIARKTKGINMILNAHDHENFYDTVNNVSIVGLGKDGENYQAIKFLFNDEGKLDKVSTKTFTTGDVNELETEMHPLNSELNHRLQDDMKPIVSFADNQYGMRQLVYNDGLRYENSPFANYITSAVRETLKEMGVELDSMAVNSSAIRGGIYQGANNLDLLKVFDGIKRHISMLEKAELKGSELLDIIKENVLDNLKEPTRNTILQWSDVQVNRTLFEKIQKGESNLTYADAIKVRDKETGEYVPLNLDKTYGIVLTNKYVNKEGIPSIRKVRDKFSPVGIKIQDAFRKFLMKNKFEIKITPEIVENRII